MCHLLTESVFWVPSTSPDRSDWSHPCLVVLPASVLKTHFHCCCLKMKMPLRTASSIQPHAEAATITQAKHTLTRIEQDDGLKAHEFLPLKVHHAKPSSSSQQHVKDFHHPLYTLSLIPVWIPSMGRHSQFQPGGTMSFSSPWTSTLQFDFINSRACDFLLCVHLIHVWLQKFQVFQVK